MFRRIAFIASTLCCLNIGCSSETKHGGPGGVPPGKTAPQVDVVAAVERSVTDFREFTGRTTAVNSVEIRSRVAGFLVQSPRSELAAANRTKIDSAPETSTETKLRNDFEVTVKEGSFVTSGTPLFEIDPAPFELALKQSTGSLESSQAQLKRLNLELSRAKDLLKSNSIAQADYDLAVANQAEAVGRLVNLQAAVDQARLDLSFTRITAPIDGLLGRTLVTVGNLIAPNSVTLTTIVSQDPIHVYFDVDEQSLLDYRKRILSGTVASARTSAIPVTMSLANESDFPHAGTVDFVDNQTDPNTGNTRIRASFANPKGELSPGLFARILSPFTSEYQAVLVPTKALSMDQQGRYVMIVSEDATALRRGVAVGSERDGMSNITLGLKAGERVIVSGLQKVAPGAKVTPNEVPINN